MDMNQEVGDASEDGVGGQTSPGGEAETDQWQFGTTMMGADQLEWLFLITPASKSLLISSFTQL